MEITKHIKQLVLKTQDLKSWASRNGACRFKSGPGHQSYTNQILRSNFGLPAFKSESGVKGSQYETSDATVTPLLEVQ